MEQLLQNYIKSFKIHVGTKTTDLVLHEFLAKVYDNFFNNLHTILEKRQDLWLDKSIDCDNASKTMMELLESEKSLLEWLVKEKNSIGMDNLLRWLMDNLEWLIGTAKWFIESEIEEDNEDKPKLWIKIWLTNK